MSILRGVYDRSLKWAYADKWENDDPLKIMPQFRPEVVSSKSYKIESDSILFMLFVWKKLTYMIKQTQLTLPQAKKLFRR